MATINKKILHTVFEATVEKFPEHTAVVHGSRVVSYNTLNRRADEIARRLKSLGVGKDAIVGMWMESAIEYIEGIIGVLKAGGVFLPLDVTFPEKRLRTILDNTTPRVTMVRGKAGEDRIRRLADRGVPDKFGDVLVIEGDLTPYISGEDRNSIVSGKESVNFETSGPDDAAYIMYTSGSTGEPKAILGRQKSLSHFMHWEVREFGLDAHIKVSQLTPVTFDASLRDIFTPLITGGAVYIPETAVRTNIHRLIRWIEEMGVTLIHCTPSLFRLMIRELEDEGSAGERLPALELILLAGEALYGRDVMRWMDLTGSRTELVNLYGPSETTLVKTFHRIEERPPNPDAILSVGQPISNTAVLILKGDRLCEIGEMGDIYIKTPFRAKGYYNNPERTKNRFVQNPLNSECVDIIYKTGDMGRYLPDRSVTFMGRRDDQVKVNGVRIEPAEIEKALMGVKDIQQAAAVAIENCEKENTLACYYTGRPEVEAEDVRMHLRKVLPPYMIPAFFIRLDAFPLNHHGKIDRKALPQPEAHLYEKSRGESPSGEIEETLVRLWKEVLDLPDVGVNRSFFELGGHSLKAARVISRIYKNLNVEIDLKDFFENATIRKLAAVVSDAETSKYREISPVRNEDRHPLSHAQRRLWILDRMEDGGIAYNIAGGWLLEGALDITALNRAFEQLVQRHESLRTIFVTVDGEPEQEIRDFSPGSEQFALTVIEPDQPWDGGGRDHSGASGLWDHHRTGDFVEKEARTPFDLSRGPLFRIKLLKMAPERFLMAFTIHHIIGDAWSFDVLARELSILYNACLSHVENPLPPLKIQYKDYTAYQNALLASGNLARHADYWHHRLSGPLPVLDLIGDHPRPPVQTYHGAVFRFDLDRESIEGLLALGKNRNVTLFMILLTLVKVFLYRRTGQEDIIVGAPAKGRNHPDLENQVGFYVNTLALRNQVKGEDSFETALETVKRSTLDAYDHQSYPFDRLVDELAPAKDVSHAPIFDVMVVLQNKAQRALKIENLKVTWVDVESKVSRFDLTFEFTEHEDRLQVGLNYNVALFDEKTVRRMGRGFRTLVKSVLEDAAQPLRDLNILDDQEKWMLIEGFNDTKHPFPGDKTLVDLFEEQVEKTPDHIAVSHGETRITYQELNDRADQIARFLVHKLYLEPGDLLGLMIDRGTWSVIALLGILKAGGVYLPIDPFHPRGRIHYMLEDSGCRALLTEKKHRRLAEGAPVKAIVDLGCIEDAGQRDGLRACRPSPRDLAYVIYTSGSTGKPKGVMVEHRGFVNMSLAQIREFGVTSEDRVLQFASASFDASLSEIFMALLSGASVVIIDKEIIDDPRAFLEYVDKTGATVITFPPLYLNALNRSGLDTVRTIITAGEPAITDDVAWYGGKKNFFNAYGPTETSVCASIHKVVPDQAYARNIPIGPPISNTSILMLSDASTLVPIGVPGEICVAGIGLARGYLNRPGLTREKFVPHPFEPGERMYRSGDLGRYRSDGEVEFLGRKDEQIKIRGHRVEPGEIENTLLRHPLVAEAVVLFAGEQAEQLTAYIVGKEGLDLTELKSHIGGFLPHVMAPDRFVLLERIPLTTHGKIDKKALSEATVSGLDSEMPYTAPRNDLERKLVGLWEDVLGKSPVGVHHNFFDLGGDSLQSVRLVSKAFTMFGEKFSVKLLFLNPTVARLARAIESTPMLTVHAGKSTGHDRPAVSSPYLIIEQRPLRSLITEGEMAPVDAAALTYLPDNLVQLTGLGQNDIIHEWCHGLPVVSGVVETSLGRIAQVTIPRFSATLHADEEQLLVELVTALKIAGDLGARTAALTGFLPSATDNGLAVSAAISGRNGFPRVTTGQATITAVMALTIRKILKEGNRRLEKERVGLLGLDALGQSTLGVMLKHSPHPREIILLDVHRKPEFMETFKKEIIEAYDFQGPVRIMEATREAPAGFYDATLIIGATNAPEFLSIDNVKPGTLIVDETNPHCFDPARAIARIQKQKDILFTEGDALHSPTPTTRIMFLPREVEDALNTETRQSLSTFRPAIITGCVFSGLLSTRFENLRPTIGHVDIDTCLQHLEILRQLGFQATAPHCEGWIAPEELIAHFRNRYGGNQGMENNSVHEKTPIEGSGNNDYEI